MDETGGDSSEFSQNELIIDEESVDSELMAIHQQSSKNNSSTSKGNYNQTHNSNKIKGNPNDSINNGSNNSSNINSSNSNINVNDNNINKNIESINTRNINSNSNDSSTNISGNNTTTNSSTNNIQPESVANSTVASATVGDEPTADDVDSAKPVDGESKQQQEKDNSTNLDVGEISKSSSAADEGKLLPKIILHWYSTLCIKAPLRYLPNQLMYYLFDVCTRNFKKVNKKCSFYDV